MQFEITFEGVSQMRKIIAILLISFLTNQFVFKTGSAKTDSNERNMKVLFSDAVENNNILALLAVGEMLQNGSPYQAIGLNEEEFQKKKLEICNNFLSSQEAGNFKKNDIRIIKSFCSENKLL